MNGMMLADQKEQPPTSPIRLREAGEHGVSAFFGKRHGEERERFGGDGVEVLQRFGFTPAVGVESVEARARSLRDVGHEVALCSLLRLQHQMQLLQRYVL